MLLPLLKAVAQDERVGLTLALVGYFSIFMGAAGSRVGKGSLDAFAFVFALCVIFAALILLLTFIHAILRRSSVFFALKWLSRGAFIYLSALLLVTSMLISVKPTSAWDFLSYWSLEVLSSMPNITFAVPDHILFEPEKHPWMISGFLANSLTLTENSMVPAYFWFGLLMLNVLCLKLFVTSLRLELTWMCPALCIFLTPLIENHFANFGYAEVALCLGLTLFFFFFHNATRSHAPVYFSLAVLTALSLMLIKTSGLVLSIICLLALCGSYPKFYNTSHTRILCYSGSVCVATVVASVCFSGWNVAALKTGTIINPPDLSVVISIFQRAFMVNVSFSVTAVLSVICFCYLVPAIRHHPEATSILCLLHMLIGLGTFLLLFVLTEYGLGHSLPDSDTSFSRLAIPATGLVSILFLFSGHVLQTDRNCSKRL